MRFFKRIFLLQLQLCHRMSCFSSDDLDIYHTSLSLLRLYVISSGNRFFLILTCWHAFQTSILKLTCILCYYRCAKMFTGVKHVFRKPIKPTNTTGQQTHRQTQRHAHFFFCRIKLCLWGYNIIYENCVYDSNLYSDLLLVHVCVTYIL